MRAPSARELGAPLTSRPESSKEVQHSTKHAENVTATDAECRRSYVARSMNTRIFRYLIWSPQ